MANKSYVKALEKRNLHKNSSKFNNTINEKRKIDPNSKRNLKIYSNYISINNHQPVKTTTNKDWNNLVNKLINQVIKKSSHKKIHKPKESYINIKRVSRNKKKIVIPKSDYLNIKTIKFPNLVPLHIKNGGINQVVNSPKKKINLAKRLANKSKINEFKGFNTKNKRLLSNFNSEEKNPDRFTKQKQNIQFDPKSKSLEKKEDLLKESNNRPTYLKNKLEKKTENSELSEIILNDEELDIQAKQIFLNLIKESPDILNIRQEIKSKFYKGYDSDKLFDFKSKIEYYDIKKLIGKGNFGKVYLGIQVLTNRPVAIKVLAKKKLKNKEAKDKVDFEIKILKSAFGHKNIIKIFEIFEDEEYFFFIFEYCEKGDLLNYLKSRGKLDENKSKKIVYNILKGLKFLHNNNILHRDIKLDNILLFGNNIPKIGDFGISIIVKDNEIITDTAGTPAYLAPEIIKAEGDAGYKSDVWSLGILLYGILFGTVPFKAPDLQDLYRLIIKGKWTFPEDQKTSKLSKQAFDIMSKMICYKIKNRLSIDECLNHPWLKSIAKEYSQLKEFEGFNNLNDLKKNISIKVLNKLGFPKEYTTFCIENKIHNHCTSCFFNIYDNLDVN